MKLGVAPEPHGVIDDCDGPNRNLRRIWRRELLKLYLVGPDLSQEIRKHLDVELFAGTTLVAEAERRIARVIANRKRLAVDDSVDRPEGAVDDFRLPAVADRERSLVERALGEAECFCFRLVILVTGSRMEIAVGIELESLGAPLLMG
jgi:hypothetical protein